ncbi:uncharacterized protein LOC122088760 [Macadamia integrifolia]|uniref:uncharacterized protein LOC122088760 n=1 Tax=Macadamia integrifolia TaxID=60698 RepID=UPI001C4F2091|nr:uncharacterized protein LOC122088760 [Macadamia integrifolia]XP_042514020.1 uncharacterized protein LOC122088760 [Macadamia integrifolia]
MASSLCTHQVTFTFQPSGYHRKSNTNNCSLPRRSPFVSPQTLKRFNGELRLSHNFSISNKRNYKQRQLQTRRAHSVSDVVAAQSNFVRVLQTVWRVAKDGIKAGTNLVPDSVPRPVASIGIAGIVLIISVFVLNSFLSTAFFILGMGFIYFVFMALNKDKGGPKGGGGPGGPTDVEDSLEEARRIMEKYK